MRSPAERAAYLSMRQTVELPGPTEDFVRPRRSMIQSILTYITCNWK